MNQRDPHKSNVDRSLLHVKIYIHTYEARIGKQLHIFILFRKC